jgi:hypothetical protein
VSLGAILLPRKTRHGASAVRQREPRWFAAGPWVAGLSPKSIVLDWALARERTMRHLQRAFTRSPAPATAVRDGRGAGVDPGGSDQMARPRRTGAGSATAFVPRVAARRQRHVADGAAAAFVIGVRPRARRATTESVTSVLTPEDADAAPASRAVANDPRFRRGARAISARRPRREPATRSTDSRHAGATAERGAALVAPRRAAMERRSAKMSAAVNCYRCWCSTVVMVLRERARRRVLS